MVRRECRLVDQELDGDRLAVRQHALAVLEHDAGLAEQLLGVPQRAAVLAAAVGHRRHIGLAEHFVRQLAAKRLEQREFGGVRLALRHHRRILEHRMRALVGAVHDVLVGPFEIEGVDQRLAQAAVLEFLAPHIDEPALRAGRRIVRQDVALDAAVLEGREIVARRPGARGELLAEQIVLGGEADEGDLAVAVIFVAHRVEIALPDRHRQTGAPPVLHPLELDEMPDVEAADLVGAAAERNIERRLIERLLRIIGLGEDRQPGDKQRHVAAAFGGKARHHGALVDGLARR